jgi:23S rRNA (adenine2503-C2)-methyltransferase
MANANKMMARPDIKDLTHAQLADWLSQRGLKAYRAAQILRWVHGRQVDCFEQMTDLGKALRVELAENFCNERLEIVARDSSEDGTVKYLFELADGHRIESVLIPERNHFTLCISSQVGCAQGCRFCLTGMGGLVRNLSRGEIISQVRDIRRLLADPKHLTNIVLMGMGEPLANYRNVIEAVKTFTDTATGFGFASRRITLSTVGLIPGMEQLGNESSVSLAVSLNAVDNRSRGALMPINRTYPIDQLIEACRRYPLKPHRRITFEYILLKDVNDSPEDARALARLLRPVKAKINLIPFNTFPGAPFERPEPATIERFQQVLLQANYTAVIRHSKGRDISAACGQLRANRGAG